MFQLKFLTLSPAVFEGRIQVVKQNKGGHTTHPADFVCKLNTTCLIFFLGLDKRQEFEKKEGGGLDSGSPPI